MIGNRRLSRYELRYEQNKEEKATFERVSLIHSKSKALYNVKNKKLKLKIAQVISLVVTNTLLITREVIGSIHKAREFLPRFNENL